MTKPTMTTDPAEPRVTLTFTVPYSVAQAIAARLQPTDANFFTRAVACHDDMLKALKRIAVAAPHTPTYWDALEAVSAAIAKAEGR